MKSLAFLGNVVAPDGREHAEIFIVDLPADLTRPGDGPLEGTALRRPAPPLGVRQRRLTFTSGRRFPGVVTTPRHWVRASPDGSQLAFLMKDDAGVVQFWTISPAGGEPRQVTRHATGIASAFTWSPDGTRLAHVMDNSVYVTEVATGRGTRLTPRTPDAAAPLPLACVISPDGRHVAYLRNVPRDGATFSQVFVVSLP
jgi:Tol biopolymer transport system component